MASYRGLDVIIPENDPMHLAYLQEGGAGRFSVQRCRDCSHLRYPPGYACPQCQSMDLEWQALSGKGTIHSYFMVLQAINPAFRDWAPYPVVLIELDEQRNAPREHQALRMIANVVDAEGQPEPEERIAIGGRVEVTFVDLGDGLALPQFRLSDEEPEHQPWQIPSGE